MLAEKEKGGLMQIKAAVFRTPHQPLSIETVRFQLGMPKYLELYRQGRLNLDDMISRRGRLEDVPREN